MFQENEFDTGVSRKNADQLRATITPESDDANTAPSIFIHYNE